MLPSPCRLPLPPRPRPTSWPLGPDHPPHPTPTASQSAAGLLGVPRGWASPGRSRFPTSRVGQVLEQVLERSGLKLESMGQ